MGRPDGKVVKNLPEYRRMMPYFLRHKYESLYYWDYDFDTEKSDDFLERMSEEYGMRVTYFHLVLHSLMKTYVKYPRVNRFVKAGKIFQRDRIWFSFSIKKEMSTEAKVSIVKREFKPDFTLKDTVKAAKKDTKMGKAGKGDKGEKEAKNYLRFPGPIIRLGYYEIGTIGVFIVVGAFVDKVVPEDGKPVIKRICPFKVTVDERSEDGFYFFKAFEYFRHQLENPEKLLEPAEQGK
jgi:hypothetical protein